MKHNKKIIFTVIILILFGLLFALLPVALKPVFELTLRRNGFPKAHVETIHYLADGIYINKILLDPNGFTEIDDLEIRGNWKDILLHQTADRLIAKTLVVAGEIDSTNRLTIAGWDGTLGASSNNGKPLPFHSFFLDNLTVDLDTPIGGIRIQGKMNLDSDLAKGTIINASIISSQQQLTSTLDIKAVFDSTGNLSGKIDISDTSINIAPVAITRASGWIEFKNKNAAGEIQAGGIKYKDQPFEDGNLVFDTSLASVADFKTKMTGRDVTLAATLMTKPRNTIQVTANASNAGELAMIAGIKNSLLSGSGPVKMTALIPLNDNLAPQREITVADTSTSVAGGIIDVKPFIWYGDGRINSLTVELKNMQLAQFLDKNSSVSAQGSVSGVVPISYQGQEITLNHGVIRSDQPGSFSYTPITMPQSLQGGDERMETVRKALSHYNYDTLQMTFDGPLNGNLKTVLQAKGSSPAFDNRPVNLNLNLEGALASALTQALKPGTLSDSLKNNLTKDAK